MTPIPRHLLIHSAVLKRPTGDDSWGKETYAEPINLRRVRIEPYNKMVIDANGKQIQLSAMMFYDSHNSEGMTSSFKQNDVVIFEGIQYRIAVAEPLFDLKFHHFEIGLI